MVAYATMFTLMSDSAFQGRIEIAQMSAATDVLTELASTTDHSLRLKWANHILDGKPDMTIQEVSRYVCANSSVISSGVDIADASLKTVVVGLIPQFITKVCE